MKKRVFKTIRILISILLVANIVSSCGFRPEAPVGSKKASSKMKDGRYHAKFSAEDLEKKDDAFYLNVEFFQYDRWKKEKFDELKEGDTIKLGTEEVKIDTIIPMYQGDGKMVGKTFNADIDEGGHAFLLDENDTVYRETGYDNSYILYSIGKTKMKISKDVSFEDRTILNGPNETLKPNQISYYDDIEACINSTDFYENNTYVEIKNNEIVNITIEWVP